MNLSFVITAVGPTRKRRSDVALIKALAVPDLDARQQNKVVIPVARNLRGYFAAVPCSAGSAM